MSDDLMSRDEAAAVLGVAPQSVRHVLRRYGVTEERGYPPERVREVARNRKGQGRRTDLHVGTDDSEKERPAP